MKKITFIMVAITIILSLGMIKIPTPLNASTDHKTSRLRDEYLNIMTVNKAQADMVRKIVGDKHNIQYMFRNIDEINDYKWSNEIVNNVSSMDIFIYTGQKFEIWMDDFLNKINKNEVSVVDLSRGIRTISYNEGQDTKVNPYYFTGIEEYKISLYNIKTAIQDEDPKNRDFYEKKYEETIKDFTHKLDEYKHKGSTLQDYTFLTFNNKFDYILKSLGYKTECVRNNYIDVFIKDKKLDSDKIIIVQDGENLKDLNNWFIDGKCLEKCNVIELWEYYDKMPFDELILYNVKVISDLEQSIPSKNEE